MRLTSITVRRFRNFVEDQEIHIEDDVTCLVGKNESGKTTVLKAPHRLNPANGTSLKFNMTQEYPRWRLARDRRANSGLSETRPIQATFALDAADIDALAGTFGVRIPENVSVHASRDYDNDAEIWFSYDDADVIVQAAADVEITGDDLDALTACEDLVDARSVAKEQAKSLKDADEPLRAKAMTAFGTALNKYGFLEGGWEQEQVDTVWDRLPKFFYFSSYNVLPGETDLNDLASKIAAGKPLTDRERSVVALLAHAGERPQDFMDSDYDSRKAELQAASVDLSQHVFEYWRQNNDLDVIFDTDSIMVEEPDGVERPHRILKIELRDGRHGNVETNFSTRSTGFQWFFSFFAAFSEYQHSKSPIIVLLDEPGTSLHGDAQRDFVRFIFEELGSSKQTIYTTHSQHMVDPTKYEKLRGVHDRATRSDPDQGVVVTPISLSADPSTMLPVESALGYSVSQHLFIGSGQHLLVEGSSDFVYLQRLTEYLLVKPEGDNHGLDPRLAILPVGGIDNMPAFVALLGRRLAVTALVDGDRTNAKLQRIQKAARHNGVGEDAIVVCSDLDKLPSNADIEDLFDVADYLKLFNWAFNEDVKASDLPNTDEPIIKKITGVRGAFDHAVPAHALTDHREEFFESIKPKTVKQFAALFSQLNGTVNI
ncbi:energy-coupling factor transporter ATP-binding protein EcfA2 [Nocardioides sp. BE266]|uniref:ATP-dependent nuclease n=1 Tax=Nocardioides sp. BE266 TaxID=2817725 RepID=UPI002865F6D7|nr:AAA family ATPase [Nocardioides sp. BE266]MDR7251903.1 energy-coupling factor transporter ATP-binding protein EcfA2 [Nocardioides sp. BE266]